MAMKGRNMRSALGKARGLGSARSGVEHWWFQRLTAIGLIPLLIYLLISLMTTVLGADYEQARAWVQSPLNATTLLLFFAAGFYHANLGLQVVIEDYISNENCRIFTIICSKLINVALAVLSLFSILAIAFA